MEQEQKTHLELGIEAFKAGNIDGAISELELATREEAASAKAFSYLGAAYAQKERYNAAIGAFKQAEQINANVPSIHYNLGQAYEAAGIPQEAVFEYESALRLDREYAKAATALQALLARLRKES